MFVRTMRGEHYPLTAVESFWPEKGPNNTQSGFAHITDVGKTELFYGEYERLSGGTSQCFKADPRYYTLERFRDEGELEILKNAIFGWAVDETGGVVPITIEGVNNGESRWDGILTPDGNIIDFNGTIYDSMAEYEAG